MPGTVGTDGGAPGRVKLVRPLRHRNFALLWLAMSVSLLGDGLYTVAIAWLAYDEWGGAGALAAFGVTFTLAQALLLLPAGVVSDRLNRRSVMVISDVIRAVAIAVVAILTATDTAELWHLVALIFVYGAGEALFFPAFAALVPVIVPRDELVQANSVDHIVRPLALQLFGPALGGFAVGLFGVAPAFFVDAGSFAFSAVVLLLMTGVLPARGEGTTLRSPLQDAVDGLRWVRGQRWLWAGLVWASLFLLAFLGPFEVLVPGLVKDDLGGSATQLGFIFAFGGLGSIVASLVVAQRGMPRHAFTVMYIEWTGSLLIAAAMGLVGAPWQAMMVAFGVGGLFTAGNLIWNTRRQQLVPPELQGRVASIDWFASASLVPLSMAVAAPVSELIGVRETLTLGSLVAAVMTMVMLWVPGVREVNDPLEARQGNAAG